MRRSAPLSFLLLAVFAAVSTASIALQNVLWAALVVFWFEKRRTGERIDLPSGPFTIATLLFIASFFVGALLGVDPSTSFKTVHKYLTLLAIPFLAAMRLDPRRVDRLLDLFSWGAAFCAAYGIGKYAIGLEGRISSFSGHWMVFGGLLMTAVLVQVRRVRENPRSVLSWLVLALVSVGLVLTQTRGAWFGAAAGFAWFALRVDRKLLSGGIAALVLGLLLMPAPLKERVRSIWDANLSYSNMERVAYWRAGWAIHRDHPAFGIGQGNIEVIYPRYRVPEALEPTVGHMHNNFLQTLVQNGWVGLAVYLAWIAAYFRESLRIRLSEGPDRARREMFIAIFLATLVWGLTEYTFSHQYMMVMVLMLGLQWGGMNSKRSEELGVRS